MAAALATAPRGLSRLFDPPPAAVESAPTLDDVVVLAWVCLQSDGSAPCPVCDGTIRSGAGCPDCGSKLS